MSKHTAPTSKRTVHTVLTMATCAGAITIVALAQSAESPTMAPVRESQPEHAVVGVAPAPGPVVLQTPMAATPPRSPSARRQAAGLPARRAVQTRATGQSLRPAATPSDIREAAPASEPDYRTDIYRYREPATPDGQESSRARARCEQQARHVPAGERLTYGELTRGSLAAALAFCLKNYG